jgi:hypothetical protein
MIRRSLRPSLPRALPLALALLGVGPGSVCVAQAGAGDSATARADTTKPQPAGSTMAAVPVAPAPPVSIAPVDTTLAAGCAGERARSLAPDLLMVTFRPGTPPSERAKAAHAVGGTLAGPVDPDTEYFRVPAEGSDAQLQAIADRVIRLDPVTEVSPAVCPPQPEGRDSTLK